MNEKQKIKNELEMARNAVKEAGLYLVSKKEIDKLAEGAMDAYQNYPLHNWLSGGTYNPLLSKLLMKVSLKTMIDNGIIYADSSELNGFTAWMPPNYTGTKALPFMLKGGFNLIRNFGFDIIKKLTEYDDFAMNLKKKFTEHNDWYLFNLSIKKDAQGKGIASKLMRPMLQFCDDERMVSYLETNKEANVGLYRHYGFDLMKEEQIPKSTVTHYAMVRKPIYKE